MKKILLFLTVFALFFTGCAVAPQPEPEPQPVYGTAPALSERGMTVEGKALSGIYTENGVDYIKMKEFAAAVGETFTVNEGLEVHTASITHPITAVNFSTDVNPPEGVGTLYLCNAIYDGTDWYQPLEKLLSLYQFHLLKDEERNHSYYTTYPAAESVAEGIRVPTLMYHAVSDDCWGIRELFVSPSELEKQLQYLQENGYTTVTFEDFGRLNEIEKPVLLTFDDGYNDNYTELFPLLKKYNAKATVFMIMNSVGGDHYLTVEQIKEMDASGLVSFQSHTMTHEYLSTRTAEQLEYELYQSKIALARLIGKESFVIAYPTGKYSEASLAATEEHYEFGLLMRGGTYTTGTDPVKIPRSYVSRYTDISSFASLLK